MIDSYPLIKVMDQILLGSYTLWWLNFDISGIWTMRYGVELLRSQTLPLLAPLQLGTVVPSQRAAPSPEKVSKYSFCQYELVGTTHPKRQRYPHWHTLIQRNTGFYLFPCEGKMTFLVQKIYIERVGYS